MFSLSLLTKSIRLYFKKIIRTCHLLCKIPNANTAPARHKLQREHFFPAATKLGQGNVFTGVCDSVHRGEVSASVDAGIPTPGSRHPPPGSRHPPGADTPQEQTPPEQTPPRRRLQHTVNERPVRILLECILVCLNFGGQKSFL